jgi:hypothetical protein
MKNHICDTCKVNMELVPPGCHRRNAAEVAIPNFKAHHHLLINCLKLSSCPVSASMTAIA